MPELVLGTRNRKKCEELVTLLAPLGLTLKSLADFPDANGWIARAVAGCW